MSDSADACEITSEVYDLAPPSSHVNARPAGAALASVAVLSAEARRSRKLRARRIRIEELQLGDVRAEARHAAIGVFVASVEDISPTGMALVLTDAAQRSTLMLTGDRIEHLRVSCGKGILYEGNASIRHVQDRGQSLVLGIEVDSTQLDLSELYRLSTRHSFAERFQAIEEHSEGISKEFKAWVADLQCYLESLKAFLDSEERSLDNLDQFSRDHSLRAYLEEVAPRVIERLNASSSELAEKVGALADEQHAAHRRYYKERVLGLITHSPLLRRAYSKPLGYAGDYEMMNMIYRDPAEGTSLFGRVLNLYAAQEPCAQAVRNRVDYLGEKIRASIEVRGRARIASIGCGPARELAQLLERSPELGRHLEVALIDQEERVLTFCERTLSPLAQRTGARIQFIRESIRRLLTTQQLGQALGARDFIYSAGLFDYLNQRSFTALLSVLYEALTPTGQLLIGNVASGNPTRYFMEYCLDWFLIHRSPDDLRSLAAGLEPRPSRVEVDAEPLGVNLFLRVWK